MRKNLLAILIICILAGLILSSLSVAAGDKYLITPGVGVGDIKIGKTFPKSALTDYGKPTSYTPPDKGPGGQDSGGYFWQDLGLMVKVNDGKKDDNVFAIYIMGNKFHTKGGIKVGSSFAQVKKTLPGGITKKPESDYFEADYIYEVNGASIYILKDKVTIFFMMVKM